MVRKIGRRSGFTLIEILVVMAIVATLLSLVAPRYFETMERSKEATLRHDLSVMRDAIDKYYSDKGAYPDTLEDLIYGQYLRAIPDDPITQNAGTWIVTPPSDPNARGSVYNIHSGAEGEASDGSMYVQW
jgi:general secretion pathway protein G